jgi:hypothetical protein
VPASGLPAPLQEVSVRPERTLMAEGDDGAGTRGHPQARRAARELGGLSGRRARRPGPGLTRERSLRAAHRSPGRDPDQEAISALGPVREGAVRAGRQRRSGARVRLSRRPARRHRVGRRAELKRPTRPRAKRTRRATGGEVRAELHVDSGLLRPWRLGGDKLRAAEA